MTTATMSDEEAVRSAWDMSRVGFYTYGGATFYINFAASGKEIMGRDRDAAWSAARGYTEQVLEEARQMREEISYLCAADYSGPDGDVSAHAAAAQERSIKRLESLYAEHVRGLRKEIFNGQS